MARNLFSVSIFFIVFRETVEAAIIVSVLLSFVEQLMAGLTSSATSSTAMSVSKGEGDAPAGDEVADMARVKRIVRRMRIQIWAGTFIGFGVALAIGAAFIAVFYTKLTDLWASTEYLWEGIFSIVASVIIYLMGLAFLKMDRSRVKWRVKLAQAFDDRVQIGGGEVVEKKAWWRIKRGGSKQGGAEKYALLLLPLITVLREGLEAVVFVGGVSLGQPAESIPIAVIVGIIAGACVGYLIYRTGSTATLHWFLVGSTFVLFLVGAGLFSNGIGFFQYYRFSKGVGGDVSETGDGPGSFEVAGNVWHMTYGNPEPNSATTNGGWQIFNSILGWNNTASLGTILGYCLYWFAIICALVYYKWSEGRISFFGKKSAAALEREHAKAEKDAAAVEKYSGAQVGMHTTEKGALERGMSDASGKHSEGSGSATGSGEMEEVILPKA